MIYSRRKSQLRRRGVSVVEAAVVYPITILLLLGTVVLGLGVFRYQQIQSLAREGARYASVHGPQYAADSGSSNGYATSSNALGITSKTTWRSAWITPTELHSHLEPEPSDRDHAFDRHRSAHYTLGAGGVLPIDDDVGIVGHAGDVLVQNEIVGS